MDEINDDHKYDLPLMANSNEIQIKHYMLDIECEIGTKVMKGSIYMILDTALVSGQAHRFNIQNGIPKKDSKVESEFERKHNKEERKTVNDKSMKLSISDSFNFVLDSQDICYHSAEEVILENIEFQEKILKISSNTQVLTSHDSQKFIEQLRSCETNTLSFLKEEWCIKIWKEGVLEATNFPQIVKITYETIPNGASLRWATDQDGNPCAYSAAMWINNRSFMPCQEYVCFSTWQAWITVPKPYVVLMSGDAEDIITQNSENKLEYYYYCSMPLPSFTLAIAVGMWKIYKPEHQSKNLIFAPPSLLEKAIDEFSPYIDTCTHVIQEILGPSPFPRIDIMIYPSCSQDMAMANPNLLFLSQSMLCGDHSLCIKLAHEISHYWFGLLIGAKDWTEEWLSEGFATFVEDIIHARIQKWNIDQYKEHSELRALLKLHTLSAEVENTQEDLQTLRPNRGNIPKDNDSTVMYVKNGINPKKLFTQVHYLKGYFLLKHLCNAVGVEEFTLLLKDYIVKYHGHMVLSQDFITMVLNKFPQLIDQGITEKYLYAEWLDTNGIPKALLDFEIKLCNSLYSEVKIEAQKWRNYNKRRCKVRGKKQRKVEETFVKLTTDQQVLLLEMLLQEKKLTQGTLTKVKETYCIQNKGNPDVRHRWCELVIKHKCTNYYDDVKSFLLNDQAMGVYLYGELIISCCKRQRLIAEECFQITSKEMESGTKQTVRLMVYGTTS